MSGFEWTAIGLILFGMVIPFWMMTVFASKAHKRNEKSGNSPSRFAQYTEVMDYLHSCFKRSKGDGQNGATLVAALRELRNFPEQRDLTILYLEEVNVTGSSKFDKMAKAEIKNLEAAFLEIDND